MKSDSSTCLLFILFSNSIQRTNRNQSQSDQLSSYRGPSFNFPELQCGKKNNKQNDLFLFGLALDPGRHIPTQQNTFVKPLTAAAAALSPRISGININFCVKCRECKFLELFCTGLLILWVVNYTVFLENSSGPIC